MKVRHFRREFQGAWRQLSRLAIAIVCLELVLVAMMLHRAEAAVPALPCGIAQGEKLAS